MSHIEYPRQGVSALDLGRCETTGKAKYGSRRRAVYVATRTANVQGERRGRAYRCDDCNCWHLTHHERTT